MLLSQIDVAGEKSTPHPDWFLLEGCVVDDGWICVGSLVGSFLAVARQVVPLGFGACTASWGGSFQLAPTTSTVYYNLQLGS